MMDCPCKNIHDTLEYKKKEKYQNESSAFSFLLSSHFSLLLFDTIATSKLGDVPIHIGRDWYSMV